MKTMQEEFSILASVIWEKGRGAPIYYLPNRGNWGDSLIRAGTKKFLRHYGLRYFELAYQRKRLLWLFDRYLPLLVRGILIYGGGGSWCKLWDKSLRVMESIHASYRHIIVLPSTFELKPSFPKTTYFARDRYESMQVVPEGVFCHDMAFFLGRMDLPDGKGEKTFFRTDKESANIFPVPEGNIDISLTGTHLTTPTPFFNEIGKYSVIHTDRLHVAIAACLLGRELHFYPGSYFKNKAVFLSSMLGYFENVHFHETRGGGDIYG